VGVHGLNVPEGWLNPFFGTALEIDWGNIITDVNRKISEDGYSLFSAMFMMMLFKGVLVSLAGPAPNYDMQKILATKSPSEASKMSGFVSAILMPVRYIMIAGFAALGIIFYDKLDLLVGGSLDFEQILPSSINLFVPTGLLGLLLAGLLAAFMSTFAGTLNAAQAYVTNDIFLKYIKPNANQKTIKISNYVIGITVVIVSIILGIQAKNVNQVVQLLVSALWGGYTAANVLKWYWWRFNSHGYFWGMFAGIIISAIPMVFPELLAGLFPGFAPDIRILYYFPIILVGSLVGCIAATYLTEPTDFDVLKKFYKNVKPWGFWKPIHELVLSEDPKFLKNSNFKRDAFNIIIGILWQTSLVALPMYIIFHEFTAGVITLVIAIIFTFVLKKSWYDKLHEYDN
jgi:Na+/proline symporter